MNTGINLWTSANRQTPLGFEAGKANRLDPATPFHPAFSGGPASSWQQAARRVVRDWNFFPCLRVSVTGECNLRCVFCHNEGNSKRHGGLPLPFYRALARDAAALGLNAVKLSGGEPTLREDLPEIVSAFRQAGFADISLITNGVRLSPALLGKLKAAGLNRLTVSLHTLVPELYERVFRAPARNLGLTLDNLSLAAAAFPGALKLNVVFQPGQNYPGEVVNLVRLACSLGAVLSVLSVVDGLAADSSQVSQDIRRMVFETFRVAKILVSTKRAVKVETLVLAEGGAVELDDFRLKEAVAARDRNPYCAACPVKAKCVEGPYALRVTADGRLKPCLARRDNEVRMEGF